MIKTLNHYSGLISIFVLVIGFFLTLQTFGFTIEDKIDDITKDYEQYKTYSKAQRKDSDIVLHEIRTIQEAEKIHRKYFTEAINKNTEAVQVLSKEVRRFRLTVLKAEKSNYIKIAESDR